eukprot:scaffold257042_cov20-Tisochrysis_lutea.AAC.1
MKQGREAAARVKLLPGKRRDEAGVGCPWAVQNVYFHGHAQPYILRDDVLCYVSLCPDCLQKHVSSGLLPNVFTEIKTTLAADSKTVDDKVDECVDDYPIRGRPSTTAWTMLRDMPPMLCVASCCQGLRIWSKAAGALRQTTCSSLCRAMLPVLKVPSILWFFNYDSNWGMVFAGLTRNPSMLPRERRPGMMGQLNVEGDFYRLKMHIGWIAYEVRCSQDGCTNACAGDEQG